MLGRDTLGFLISNREKDWRSMPADPIHERLAQIIGDPWRHPGPFRVALKDGTGFCGTPFYFGPSEPLTVCCVLALDEVSLSPLRYVQVADIASII